MVWHSYPYMTTGKNIALTIWTFVSKVMSVFSNMLSRFITVFLPRSKHHLISWMQSPSTVILFFFFFHSDFVAKKIKSATVSTFSPSICQEAMGPNAMTFVYQMLSFKQLFHSLLLPLSRGSLVPFHFLTLECYHLHIWGCWYFSQQSWFLEIHSAQHFEWCTLHIS